MINDQFPMWLEPDKPQFLYHYSILHNRFLGIPIKDPKADSYLLTILTPEGSSNLVSHAYESLETLQQDIPLQVQKLIQERIHNRLERQLDDCISDGFLLSSLYLMKAKLMILRDRANSQKDDHSTS